MEAGNAQDLPSPMQRPGERLLELRHETAGAMQKLGKTTASLFLGAVAFAVAMAWNDYIASLIALWTPPEEPNAQSLKVQHNLIAALTLTIVAVLLAWALSHFYGKGVMVGQARMYGLGD